MEGDTLHCKKGFILTLISAAPLLALGCSQAADETNEAPSQLSWNPMKDGSKVATLGGGNYSSVRRCWPHDDGYECLYIDYIGNAFEGGFSANRYRASNLSQGHEISDASGGEGYSCEFDTESLAEHISGEKGDIRQNTFSLAIPNPGAKPWTRANVKNIMDKNGVSQARPYFNCPALAYRVIRSSLTVISRPETTFDDIMK